LPDADDDMVLEAAVNGRADGIVTFNLRDFGVPAEQFGIVVLSPGEAVKRLEKRS
jgi:predicted nucleic acid-binding protein